MNIDPGQATQFLSLITIVANIFAVVILITWFVKTTWAKKIKNLVINNSLWLAFIVALLATLGSLYYSEGAGYNPCKLCWLQRIFMYPLVPLLAIAATNKDKKFADYGIVLSVIGGAIAIYHYLVQIGIIVQIKECSVIGYSSSCSDQFVKNFGYITIPMMAFSAFLLITLLMISLKLKTSKTNSKQKK